MRVKKQHQTIELVCAVCGDIFTEKSRNAIRCPDCRIGNKPIPKYDNPNEELFALLRKIDKYNRENGTHLSYGKYVEKVGGKVNVKL